MLNSAPSVPALGSISHGTLRPEDLLPAYASALNSLSPGSAEKLMAPYNLAGADFPEDDSPFWNQEDLCDLESDFHEALHELAPPYLYFGANEGDGSDFGFWPDFASIDEDIHTGDLLPISDLADIPPGTTVPVLLVNDHGNASLYVIPTPGSDYKEVWSCV